MNNQLAFSPRIQSNGVLAALRTKLSELRFQWQQAMARRQQVARVTLELSVCSDRELADLGFSRADIPDVARGRFNRA